MKPQGRYGHLLAKRDSEQTWYLTFQDTPNGLVIQTYRMIPDEHKRVLDLLMQSKDVFSQSKYDIGLTHVIQHKINTGNAAAIKQARLYFGQGWFLPLLQTYFYKWSEVDQ
jgi:hypothetical protein